MTSVQQTVIIVGGGITGPVLALLLQQRGYTPIILEKVGTVGPSGIAIAIHPNGLKVLAKAGVVQALVADSPPWQKWSEYTSSGEFLGGPGSDLIGGFTERYGWPAVGFSRSHMQLTLKKCVEEAGIEYIEGWKLKHIEQKDSSVVASSEDGRLIEGALMIGCDGLRSVVRQFILEEHGITETQPNFTGIAVIAGTSPTPAELEGSPSVVNFYDTTQTLISHPLENATTVWGLNYFQDTAVPESWRLIDDDEVPSKIEETLRSVEGYPEVAQTLIKGTKRLMTIGLYDRPALAPEHWFAGRCAIIGDAAHPGTPHIGQGANQGLEDCYYLSRQIPEYREQPLMTSDLKDAFHHFAALRQPVTTELVKRARVEGGKRVLFQADDEARKVRDGMIKKHWNDIDSLNVMFDSMYQKPFSDLGGWLRIK